MTFVWSLGELVFVQPLRLGVGALARTFGLRAFDLPLYVPPMSSDWLRQYEVDADKHAL